MTQSLTVPTSTAVWAFAAVSAVFTLLIASALLGVAAVTGDTLRPVRMVGSSVRKWAGLILISVGLWFFALALLPSPLI